MTFQLLMQKIHPFPFPQLSHFVFFLNWKIRWKIDVRTAKNLGWDWINTSRSKTNTHIFSLFFARIFWKNIVVKWCRSVENQTYNYLQYWEIFLLFTVVPNCSWESQPMDQQADRSTEHLHGQHQLEKFATHCWMYFKVHLSRIFVQD